MNQGKRFATAIALAIALAGTTAAAEVRINANCSALGGCTFTNIGDDRGSACAVLVLTRQDGRSIRSSPVCSGSLAPSSTGAAIPVQFTEPVLTFCSEGACTPSVEMQGLRSDESGGPQGLLVPFLLGASAAWVYADAKKRGARRGLHPGLFDLGPGGWAVATFFLWIIAFPAYLIRRDEIAKRASQDAQPPSA